MVPMGSQLLVTAGGIRPDFGDRLVEAAEMANDLLLMVGAIAGSGGLTVERAEA